jgi:hypothetical protein
MGVPSDDLNRMGKLNRIEEIMEKVYFTPQLCGVDYLTPQL